MIFKFVYSVVKQLFLLLITPVSQQATVDAVEAENEAEKHQLSALHQQRVVAHINEMKREAMTCYTRALRETQPNVSKKRG